MPEQSHLIQSFQVCHLIKVTWFILHDDNKSHDWFKMVYNVTCEKWKVQNKTQIIDVQKIQP